MQSVTGIPTHNAAGEQVVLLTIVVLMFSVAKAKEDDANRRARANEIERERERNLKSAKLVIEELVSQHLDTLARQQLAMVRVDRYGVADASKWSAEVQHFADKVVSPRLNDAQKAAVREQGMSSLFQELLEDRVSRRQQELQAELSTIDGFSPLEFENWCRIQFERLGWAASLTKAGPDQGANVVLKKQNTTVVVQCKLYNRPVGNSAVQEIFAAKRFYGASGAAVVTNATYTASAEALAATTGVLLLKHTELGLIDEMA